MQDLLGVVDVDAVGAVPIVGVPVHDWVVVDDVEELLVQVRGVDGDDLLWAYVLESLLVAFVDITELRGLAVD